VALDAALKAVISLEDLAPGKAQFWPGSSAFGYERRLASRISSFLDLASETWMHAIAKSQDKALLYSLAQGEIVSLLYNEQ
jgi:hypothetical protein